MTDLFSKHKEIVADIKSVTPILPSCEEYIEADKAHCHCSLEWINNRGDFIGFDIEETDASYLYMYCGNYEENSFGSGQVLNVTQIKEELLKFLNAVST